VRRCTICLEISRSTRSPVIPQLKGNMERNVSSYELQHEGRKKNERRQHEKLCCSVACHKIRHNGFCDSLSICLGNDDTIKSIYNKVFFVICDTQDWRMFIVILKCATQAPCRKIFFTFKLVTVVLLTFPVNKFLRSLNFFKNIIVSLTMEKILVI